ncbi:hypothetical protein CWO85_03345 [Candidatus Phytoplasma ziziphi]|uniref:Uncharacterized protein n=2 Tax=Acholeplasmataceae TaxID=2146 RepID=A0A660HN08_ZIZJU|nr:hypothetical protein CWO85_01235 [Candidatus Phytoplasma ziziphi]AYJ01511.1 hypothetical protein CWO85_03345 [Candidatus Phytoplasma ziziphi]
MWLLLTPFFGMFTFMKDWFHGFTVAEILNRRLDFIATNILVTSFLIGFKPLFLLVKNILSFPIMFVIGFFKPKKAVHYYQENITKLLKKQDKMELKKQLLEQKKEKLAAKIIKLEKKIRIKKTPFQEEREEEEANE